MAHRRRAPVAAGAGLWRLFLFASAGRTSLPGKKRYAPLKLAVIGAGLVGRRLAEHIAAEAEARLSAIVDPSPVGRDLAQSLPARWFARLRI
jgi:hypothetical protein